MGCKEGDTSIRSTADFEVPAFIVYLPSFIWLFWCFRVKLKKFFHLLSFDVFPKIHHSYLKLVLNLVVKVTAGKDMLKVVRLFRDFES